VRDTIDNLARIHLSLIILDASKSCIIPQISFAPIKLLYGIINTIWSLDLEWVLAAALDKIIATTVQPVPVDVCSRSPENKLVHPDGGELLVYASNEHGIPGRTQAPSHLGKAEVRVVLRGHDRLCPPLVVG
jgi:hypothetical protein